METMITSSQYIALVQETKEYGCELKTKRYAYKIRLLRFSTNLKPDDVIISYADPIVINRNKIMGY